MLEVGRESATGKLSELQEKKEEFFMEINHLANLK